MIAPVKDDQYSLFCKGKYKSCSCSSLSLLAARLSVCNCGLFFILSVSGDYIRCLTLRYVSCRCSLFILIDACQNIRGRETAFVSFIPNSRTELVEECVA